MPFQQTRPLALARRDDETWVLLEPLVYQGKRESFTVPAGFVTDFASVPRVATWLVPRFGRYTLAAVLHDWLLEVAIGQGLVSSRDADGLFRRVMRELGVPPVRRWLMWTGVRWAAPLNRGRRPAQLWPDVVRMLPLTALAVLVAGVPAVAIVLGQLVYGGVELIVTALSRERTTTGVDATT